MYASVKIQLRLAYLYITTMTNGYLPINIFFSAFFNVAPELRIYLLTSWRGIQQFNEKHGQNEKEFEWLRGINVSALNRNELIFHRASERRCIDAKNPEGRWKCARHRICKRSRATKTRCTGNVAARRGAHTQSPVTKARRWRSRRHGPKRRLLTEKQESGGIIMSRLQYYWRV